ncbi:MAG TPA: autotransporter-associated beta strand repeat-containing protein, partial [Haloferula sp.]
MNLEKSGTGTLILSGTNSFIGYSDAYEGTLRIANNAAWSISHSFYIETDATLDALAMTVPVDVPSNHFANVYGSFLGDLTVSGYLEGNGFIDGNVHVQAGAYVLPDYDGQLHVTGDFTLDRTAEIEFYLASTTPMLEYNQMRVGGTVTLDGDLLLGSDPVLVEGDSFFLLLNDGTDPIHGTFHNLPEGGVIAIGNGLALQVTYQA